MTRDQNTTGSSPDLNGPEDEENAEDRVEDEEEFDDPDDGEDPGEAFAPLDEGDDVGPVTGFADDADTEDETDEEFDDPHDMGSGGDDLFIPDDGDEKSEPGKRRRGGRRSSSKNKPDRLESEGDASSPVGGGIKIADALVQLLVPIDDIHGDPSNPRLTRRLDVLKGAFSRFGIRKPIVVNKRNNTIEAGHQSVAALKELGATHVPVVWVDDEPIEQTAFNIADNRTGEVVADWDEGALAAMLEDLDDANSLDGLGFNDRELDEILGQVTTGDKSADDLLGDDFVLPSGDIEDKTAMDKITLFVVVDKKRALLQALDRVRHEIGDDLVRIMK